MNRIYDAFENIKADEQQKENTKQFLRENLNGSIRSRSRGSARPHQHMAARYAAAVCAVLVLVMGGVGFSLVRTPVSYVSIDVNPSIELGLNRFDRVVSVEAYNAEGEAILSGLPLRWKKYTEAIEVVIGCEEMEGYLTDTSELVLTVVADSAREVRLMAGVKECTSHMEEGYYNEHADINMVPEAHESGLSCGKYNAYLRLYQYDNSITIEECKEMSMAQIWERLREYESENGDENEGALEDTGEGKDCGSGYDAGEGSSSGQRGHHHRGGSHE